MLELTRTSYFGFNATAEKTLNTIIGYMPTVAHWGWNGNARRYWDFLYAGKIPFIPGKVAHRVLPLGQRVAVLIHPAQVGQGRPAQKWGEV